MRRAKTVKNKRWASDVIVDLLHAYKLPYAAMNPGASYRGLHDSIVNYGRNRPYLMLCQHEETAVQIAHGYAKASGKPMVALLQGEAVRAYTKWDYQPTVIDGVPESFARAYGVMMTEPRGPIYMCYDAWLQEQPLGHDVPLPPKK